MVAAKDQGMRRISSMKEIHEKEQKKKNLTPGEIILEREDCFKFLKEFSGRIGKIIYSKKKGALRTGVSS